MIFDTREGSSSISKEVLRPTQWNQINLIQTDVRIRDATNHLVKFAGTVDIYEEVGSQLATVKFYVVEKLGTYVILRWHFCNKHIEVIRSRRMIIELDDGTTDPIVRDAVKKSEKRIQFQNCDSMRNNRIDQQTIYLLTTKFNYNPRPIYWSNSKQLNLD